MKTAKWEKESEFALRAVSTADSLLLRKRPNNHVHAKGNPRDLVSEMDHEIQQTITDILLETGYPIIGEEDSDLPRVDFSGDQPIWLVDPIDGTVNYLSSIPHFAISVGLCRGSEFLIGAVSVPANKELFFTLGDCGAYLNGKALSSAADVELKNSLVAASFSSVKTAAIDRVSEFMLYGQINDNSRGCLRLGSAATNICYVAAGRFQAAYGFQSHLWDVAGGLAVASRAGCKMLVRLDPVTFRISYIVGSETVVDQIHQMSLANGISEFAAGK